LAGTKEITPEFERMVAVALSHQEGDWKGRISIGEAVSVVKDIELARRGDPVLEYASGEGHG
jgi:hypothetical protein